MSYSQLVSTFKTKASADRLRSRAPFFLALLNPQARRFWTCATLASTHLYLRSAVRWPVQEWEGIHEMKQMSSEAVSSSMYVSRRMADEGSCGVDWFLRSPVWKYSVPEGVEIAETWACLGDPRSPEEV